MTRRDHPMLTDEEKNRIRAEEIFRQEIRLQIEMASRTPSGWKRLWSMLNSSFALWFLSSVVIAGLTAIVTNYQKRRGEDTQKVDTQKRLNIEIGSRIAEGLVALHLDHDRMDRGQVFFASALYSEALSYLDNRVVFEQKSLDFSVYPEYRTRSFRSLVFELSFVIDPSELPNLRQADGNYKKLADLADHAVMSEDVSRPPDKNTLSEAVKNSISIFDSLQTNSFWKGQL
jgi:hypothetical protein